MKFERFEDIYSWKKAKELNKLENGDATELTDLCEEISKLLSGLIKTL
jgi:hypothetical protein